uniref:EGF-like domain-containing protein n=1 Tax=Anopheles dirus TaxID=7168 RepID=A0A182NBS3_9DIPT
MALLVDAGSDSVGAAVSSSSGCTGNASKCCNSWYSDPVSIMYFTRHRMMNRALNACHMWTLLKTSSKWVGCANGICIRPGQCACDEGYELDDNNHCVPVCLKPCQGGQCVAPGKCSCGEGYGPAGHDESVCVPSCPEPCANGDCVAPNTCVCHRNFRPRDERSPHDCIPDCPNGCVNGVCSGPGVCLCADGFLYNETVGLCQPHCSQHCENGVCIGGNQCQCHEGYQLDPKTGSKCVPQCSKSCVHGICVAPDVCDCKKAFNSKASICTPHCRNKCVNAYCIRPNVCQCLAGHRFVDNSTSVCEPICEESLVDCTNGRCTQPNVCECNEGYTLAIRNGRMLCEPVACVEQCVNGYCVAEGRCECYPGYRPSEQFDSICEPMCTGGCENGACIAPNTCVCNAGYARDPDSGSCEASCDPSVVDCYNGVCHGANQCQCLEGYFLRVRSNGGPAECAPVCVSGCANGRCLAPDECLCNDGYQYREETDTCEPMCVPGCVNGLCVAPNVCQCLEGYEAMDDPETLKPSEFECTPYCDANVVNCTFGICGGPNFCRCFDDFYSTTDELGRQTCELLPEPVECGKDVIIYEVENVSKECVCEEQEPCPVLSCPEKEITEAVMSDCDHQCHPGCVNGDCVNGSCLCEEGSVLRDGHICALDDAVSGKYIINSRFGFEEDEDDDEEDEDEANNRVEDLICPEGFRAVPATGECICDSATVAADGTCIDMEPEDRVELLAPTIRQLVVDSANVESKNQSVAPAEPIQQAESSLISGIDRDQWIIIASAICAAVVLVTAAVLICKCLKKNSSMETDIN